MKEKEKKTKSIIFANLMVIAILITSSIAIGESISSEKKVAEKNDSDFLDQIVSILSEEFKDNPDIIISNTGITVDGTKYDFGEIQEPKVVEKKISKENDITITKISIDGGILLKTNDPQPQSSYGIYFGTYLVYATMYGLPQFYTRAVGFFVFLQGYQHVIDLSSAKSLRWGWEKTYFNSWNDISQAGGYIHADATFKNVIPWHQYRAWAKVFCLPDGTIFRSGDITEI